jgi:hypothetical protein
MNPSALGRLTALVVDAVTTTVEPVPVDPEVKV